MIENNIYVGKVLIPIPILTPKVGENLITPF